MIRNFFMPADCNMKQTYIWTVLAGTFYAGSSFLMQMVTSKFIGIYQAGVLSLALAVANQLVTVGLYNIRTFQVSDVTEKYKFCDYFVLRILTVTAMLVSGFVWIGVGGYDGVKGFTIIMAVTFKAVEAFSDLLEGRYQQKGRYDTSCKSVFVKVLLYLIAFLAVLFITKSVSWGLTALALVYFLSMLFIDGKIVGYFGDVSLHSTWRRQSGLIIEAFPLFVNSFISTYIINAPKYSLEKYYDSEILGIFTVLYMMAFVVNMFASFILKPIISILAERYVKEDIKGFVRPIIRQTLIISIVTLICIMGAYLLGVPVLGLLFGVDLSSYKGALCLILVSGGFTAVYQLFQYGIIIMRHQYSAFICCGLTAIVTYFITPYLTRRYSIMGATVSYTLSMGFMSVLFIAFFIFYIAAHKKKKQEGKYE